MFTQVRNWDSKLPAIVVLIVGLLATAGTVWQELESVKAENQTRFDDIANHTCEAIENRIEHYEGALRNLQALFNGSSEVTKEEFEHVAACMDLTRDFPGVMGLAYVARVPDTPEALEAFLKEARQKSGPEFHIHTPPESAPLDSALTTDHMILEFAYPKETLAAAIGLDIGAHPVRRQAAERSMLSLEATISGGIELVRGEGMHPNGCLMLLPIFESGNKPETIGEKLSETRGWICMPLFADNTFANLPEITHGWLDIKILYNDNPNSRPFYDTKRLSPNDASGGVSKQVSMEFGQRTWTAQVTTTPEFKFESPMLAWVLGVAGTVVTLLLTYVLLTHHREIRMARKMAADMTVEFRRLAMVAERTTNGVIITDENRRIVWANEGFTRITGYDIDEVIGQVPGHFLQCDHTDPATVTLIRSAVRHGHGFHGEILNRNKQGREYWIDLEIQTLRDDDGEITGFIAIESDITARVKAERRARALATILQEAPNEFQLVDIQTLKFIEVNNGACEALGYTREELLQMSPFDINKDLTQESVEALLTPVRNGEVKEVAFDVVHTRKDGSTYTAHIIVHLTTFEDRPVYAAFCTDLTERQKLEQQLAQSQKLESIGQLAAGIAHEINTPMQCVVTNVEYLSEVCTNLFAVTDAHREAHREPPENWEAHFNDLKQLEKRYNYDRLRENTLDAIVESAEAATRVVEVVRAMKSMAHPGSIERVLLDINEMIRNSATVSRNRWKYCATLDLQLDESLPNIPLLSNQMNQVFLNLIVNAADAIAERIEKDNSDELGHIEIATWQESDGVKIRVRDNGCGMSEEVQRRAFDPFYTTKHIGQGTGQGLAISYDVVVQKHQGRITIESQHGKGTSITVWLPNSTPQKVETNDIPDFAEVEQGLGV